MSGPKNSYAAFTVELVLISAGHDARTSPREIDQGNGVISSVKGMDGQGTIVHESVLLARRP
jgi:hypothetical protein